MRGSIQHRPDRASPWRARYYGPDGRQRSKSFNRKIDAERWLVSERSKLDRGEWIDPESGQISWAEYSTQLMASRVHLAAPNQRDRQTLPPTSGRGDRRILTVAAHA